MTRFYILPDNLVDRPPLIVYSPNQEESDMTKGAWHDEEKPGHKYIKRERGTDGRWRYWYPDEHEREDKPEGSKRRHEEKDYRPPVARYSDEACIGKLMQIGDSLAEAQDGITKDDTGFNNNDVRSWGFVSASARADDPASMHRLRTFLAKYKRQIAGDSEDGLDEFYKLGLQDAIIQREAHGGPVMMARWRVSDGALLISVSGRVGKENWPTYMNINRDFKVRAKKDREGNWYNYVEPADVAGFDFEGYRKRLIEEVNVKLEDIPERPALPPPAEAPPQGAEATVQPASAGNPMTTDDVIDDIIDKRAYNTIAVKVLTQGPKAGNLAIWSTFSKDFNDIMSNKSTDPRAITGIVEVQKDMGWARITNDPRLYEEAITKLRQHLPKFTFVIDKNVDEWKAAHEAKTSERQKPVPEVQAKINPEIKPFNFQNEAVRFFMDNDGNGLLGDEMGLGKTLEALAYAAATNKRVIVACPKVVRKNWLLEAKRFFPGHFDDVKELVSKDLKAGGMPDLSKVKIATINYEILEKFMPAIQAAGFDLLIVDESHRIKNPKAQLTQNIQKIAKGIKHKILLSGTALKNKREELFTQLELVRPGFVTKAELLTGMIGVLHHKLDKVYLARKKKDVVADMPPKLKQAVQLDVPGLPQTRKQQLMEEGWDPAFDEDERESGDALGEITRIKHETAKAKAPVTADFVKELLESSDSNVLVFTDSVPAAEAIKEKLGSVAVLHTGEQSTDAQDAARAHFDPLRRKEGDHVRVLVSTTSKGIGFNAQTADKVVFNDLPWTPADKDQAEDRAYRIGTKNTVNVYDIHAAGSAFDKVTAQLLLKKAVLYHKLLDGVKMTAEETAWANTAITPAEILAAMRGKDVGPKVAEVDAPPVKTSTGMTVIQPAPVSGAPTTFGQWRDQIEAHRRENENLEMVPGRPGYDPAKVVASLEREATLYEGAAATADDWIAQGGAGPKPRAPSWYQSNATSARVAAAKHRENIPEGGGPSMHERLKAAGHKVYEKHETGQALQESYEEQKAKREAAEAKSEWQLQAEKEAAERKAKEDAEKARGRDFYNAFVGVTNPAAAKALGTVPPQLKHYYNKLHAMEASPTAHETGSQEVIPKHEGQVLQRWFRSQVKAKNPNVGTGTEGHYFYNSPAGRLHLWHSWRGEEGVWNVDYTSQHGSVVDTLPGETQAALDKMHERYRAGLPAVEPEHNERPKFVIPATKPIEEAKPAGGAPDTSPHEHAGTSATPREDRLEARVEASGNPQQLSLFKALADELFVLTDSNFDLCLSLADRLVDAGEFEQAIDLIKAAGHKYIRRYPSGKASPRWYYVYNVTSKHHDAEVQVGEKVRIHSEGQAGHYEVENVHPNGYVTVKHDETGQRMSLKKEHLHEMFAEEHQPAIQAAHQRLQRTVEAAKVHGTEKQQTMAREALRQHEERFQIKTPQRIATQKAQGLTVMAKAAPSVENHLAAAEAHEYAAGFDTEHTALHKEMAKLHRENARLRSVQEKTKKALTTPGVNFQVPGKTEAEKAAAPVLVKVIRPRGPRQAKGAFFGTKQDAYAQFSDEFKGDFHAADAAYWRWKNSGRGPKPPPWKGGELDAINHALGLEVSRSGFTVKDPRVSSMAEGWDRLVGQSKRWDSDKVMDALKVMSEVPGWEGLMSNLPPAAQQAHEDRWQAEFDAESREDMGGDYEDARLDDAVDKFTDADLSFDPDQIESELAGEAEGGDTSFDFGFNVKPEHEDPAQSYKELGPKAPTFKAWFGDWESNPAEASKVVKKDGTPAEQNSLTPIVVYHGTAVGGFTSFDPNTVDRTAIFGAGFYFTEDKEIATEYTHKDEDEDKSKWGRCHGFTQDGKPVDTIPNDLAEKIIAKTRGYAAEGVSPEYDHQEDRFMAAALKRAMGPDGVSVTKLLQEYRYPSGPILGHYGEPENGNKYMRFGKGGTADLVERLKELSGGKLDLDAAVHPPKVYEVFLNIRNPIDMDAPISKEQFTKMAQQMAWMDLRDMAEKVVAREPKKPEFYEDWYTGPDEKEERASYVERHKREMNEYEKAVARKARAKEALAKWPSESEQTGARLSEMGLAISDRPEGEVEDYQLMGQGALGGHYLDNVMSYDEMAKITGQDKSHVRPLTYEQFLALKNVRRQDPGYEKNPSGFGYKTDAKGKPIKSGKPAHGILHLSDEKTLTWGDVHWLHTNMHGDDHVKARFTRWAQEQGYDGIAHTGGWNIGTKTHKVWIAFKPNQIKATENEGTFDPTTPDLHKSMKYQPNIFVLLTEKLEKAWGEERPGHKYKSRRRGPDGKWEYEYDDEPPFHLQVPAAGSLGPITSEEIPKRIEELGRMPREMLAALDKRVDGYVKRLGTSAPAGLYLWQHAIKSALGQKPPAMVAQLPVAPAAPKAAEPPKMVATVPSKPKQMGFDFSKKAAEAITPNPTAQAKDEAALSTPAQGPDPEPVAVEAPKPEPKPEPKAKTPTAPKAKAKPVPEGKLVATGDHIWGSRYDLAQIGKITSAEQLNNMSYQDAAFIVTKNNLVPTHDLEVLKGRGMSPGAAHLALALLSTIKSKPEDTDKSRRAYVEACHEVVESVLNCKTRSDFDELLSTFRHKNRDRTTVVATLPDNLRGYNEANEWSEKELKRLQEANPDKSYGTTGYGSKIVEIDRAIYVALGPAFERFTRHSGKGPTEAFREAYRAESMEGENPGAGWEYLKTRGQANAEEKAKAKAKSAEKAKSRRAAGEEDPSNAWRQRDVPEEVERAGGKKVKDADPVRIKRTFNLREVDYGQEGWMAQKDREYHTARLEEALTDFAEILGVEPEVVSFKGRLGIALGARGHGKAAAHYETGRHVINITKFNGGGSVAHEWGHALDNIMGTVHLGNKEGKGSGIYLSEKRDHSQLPPDVREAIQDVWKAITKHPNPEEARRKHREELNKALEEANKLVRENNEKVATIRTLKEKPTAADLPKAKATLDNRIKGYQDRLKELVTKSKTERLRADERKQAESLDFWIKRYQKQRNYLDEPDAVRSPEEEARIATLEADIEDLRYDINKARARHNTLRHIDPEASEFYRGARKMGEYWHRTVELFARSFEAHIEDRLKAKGRKSTYLVSGTQPGGLGAGAYPAGAERDNINRAMGKLMDVLHKGGHLEKALRALVQPLQRFTIRADMLS